MKKQHSQFKVTDRKSGAVTLAQRNREFVEKLTQDGYITATIGHYRRTTDRLVNLMMQRDLDATDLNDKKMGELQNLVLKVSPKTTEKYTAFCLTRFREFLIEVGDAPPLAAPVVDASRRGRLKREYEGYLRSQRGLADGTIIHCMQYFDRFMTFRFGDKLGNLNSITLDNITAFLCHLREGPRPFRDKTSPSQLRNLFKFLFWSGKTKRNLAISIPRVSPQKPTAIPRYLKPEEVTQLVNAVHTDNAQGKRNYALLLLMARLGLRAPEAIAIRLDDIYWRTGEILVRGKGKFHDRMPLPAEVGEALVDYIMHGRRGRSRALFVSSIAPFRAFKDAQIVNWILHTAYDKTGIPTITQTARSQ
ncbi:MAG: site-specific integrase [Candidatus Marinimicrobia bacterium]|nr:site-specific integrase [Candidatus Neomarinimicrobiota bacterium]